MRTTVIILCLMAGGLLLAGCIDIKADASDWGAGSGARQTTAPPPDPAADPRSVGDLQRENAQLREKLAELERDRDRWQSVIARQKEGIRDLERQRDDLKRDRDRYKKALGEDDD